MSRRAFYKPARLERGLNLPDDVRARRRLVLRHASLAQVAIPPGSLAELARRLEEFMLSPALARAKLVARRRRVQKRQRRARRITRRNLK